jgi:hypothetical protein
MVRVLSLCGLALTLLATESQAQLQTWRIGGNGASWNDIAVSQSGALEVDGGLQPLELVEGQNLIELLEQTGLDWINEQPPDFLATGQPRTWSNDGFFNQLDGPLALVDGDPETSSENVFKAARNQSGARFYWDLGAPFPLNRIVFYPAPDDPDSYPRAFEILVNDGETYNDINRPEYETLRRVEVNRETVAEVAFAPLQGRFLQLLVLSKSAFALAEFEIFGEGFVPVADYLSELHSFGAPVNFGQLHLRATRLARGDGEAAENDGPTATLQMRSGTDDTPLVYFRRDRESGSQEAVTFQEFDRNLPRRALFRIDPETQSLEEVDRSTYLALPVSEQGPIRDFIQGDIRGDTENWSPWSQPVTIDATGDYVLPIDLPSPSQYLQFRFDFAGDPDNVIRIDSMRVEHFPSLVTEALGELALQSDPRPAGGLLEVTGGVDTTFVLDVRTEFADADLPGYRGIRVEAFPAPIFRDIFAGEPLVSLADYTVEPRENGFDVLFDPVSAATNRPHRLLFDLRLLEHNTPVNAWLLGNDESPPHPIHGGDASAEIGTTAINAYTRETRPIVDAKIGTEVITPNGDGINDEAEILLILSQFVGDVGIEAQVFDLGGRRVRDLLTGSRAAGAYERPWDGRDDDGNLVPPGIYMVRLKVSAAAEDFGTARLVGVAY